MWLTFAPTADAVEINPQLVTVDATSAPTQKSPWVVSAHFIQDTGQYVVQVDPGWFSGHQKAGTDPIAALARAGYEGASVREPQE